MAAAQDAAAAELERLVVRQRRLVIAGCRLAATIAGRDRPTAADRMAARLVADDLRHVRAALDRLALATGTALGRAATGRAASLAYLSVGRTGRVH